MGRTKMIVLSEKKGQTPEHYKFSRFVRTSTCVVGVLSVLVGLFLLFDAFRSKSFWLMLFSLCWLLVSAQLLYGWWKRKRNFYKLFIFVNLILSIFYLVSAAHLLFRYFGKCESVNDLPNIHCGALESAFFFFGLLVFQFLALFFVTADFGFINDHKVNKEGDIFV